MVDELNDVDIVDEKGIAVVDVDIVDEGGMPMGAVDVNIVDEAGMPTPMDAVDEDITVGLTGMT